MNNITHIQINNETPKTYQHAQQFPEHTPPPVDGKLYHQFKIDSLSPKTVTIVHRTQDAEPSSWYRDVDTMCFYENNLVCEGNDRDDQYSVCDLSWLPTPAYVPVSKQVYEQCIELLKNGSYSNVNELEDLMRTNLGLWTVTKA